MTQGVFLFPTTIMVRLIFKQITCIVSRQSVVVAT